MTVMNVTIGADFAVMATDTLAVDAGGPAGFASKVQTVPHLNMLCGGTGHWEPIREFGALIRQTPSADAVWALDEAPAACKVVASHFPEQKFRIVLAACLPDGSIRCRAFDSEQDFAPVEIAAAHAYSPTPDPQDREYRQLTDWAQPAVAGIGTDGFHELLARVQYRTWKAGKAAEGECPKGFAIGGSLILHRLDRDGIVIKRLMDFPA